MADLLKHRRFELGQYARDIVWHSQSSPKKEVCGIILKDGSIVQMENIADDAQTFEMSAEFERYRDQALLIYHSHIGADVGAELSPTDIINAKEQRIPYLSYHGYFNQWDYFDPLAIHPYPLEMDANMLPQNLNYYCLWRFEYGRSDCHSLCRAWYAGKLGIALGDYPRESIESDEIRRLCDDRAKLEGFIKLPKDTPIQNHDIISIRLTYNDQRGDHLAIVCDVDRNEILHNLGEGRYSEPISYDDHWRLRTTAIYRHKQVIENGTNQ